MNYLYDCADEVINVFRSNNEFSTKVTVETNKNGTYKCYDRSIREDENGKFFTWNKNKIYLNDFKHISIQSIKDKIAKKEYVTDDELCQAILSEGVENVRFIVPMMSVSSRFMGLITCDPTNRIEKICHIEETFNRKVSDCYKFNLVPDEYDETTCLKEERYVVDFVSAINSGNIKIV